MMMEHARAMERATFNIVRQSQISLEGARGIVRVAITEGLGTYWVLPRLLEFQKTNRYLTFELQETMEFTDVGRLIFQSSSGDRSVRILWLFSLGIYIIIHLRQSPTRIHMVYQGS